VFDNSDNRIKGEYAQYNEISIKRKVARDGSVGLLPQRHKCRRRDITDIFLGTGLGAAQLRDHRAGHDLAPHRGEARGTAHLHRGSRRHLQVQGAPPRDRKPHPRTRENLERLTDLREELGRQLQHLHRQAQAAEKYGELKQQEREISAQHSALRWKALNDELQLKQAVISELEVRIEATVADQREVEAKVEQPWAATLRASSSPSSSRLNAPRSSSATCWKPAKALG
jgi:chromosome segregation protein